MAHQGAGGGRSTGASLMRPVGRPQPLASLFAALGLVLASRPLVAQEPAATAYRATWGDAASVGTAGVLYLLPAALGLPHALRPALPAIRPRCRVWTGGPCTVSRRQETPPAMWSSLASAAHGPTAPAGRNAAKSRSYRGLPCRASNSGRRRARQR